MNTPTNPVTRFELNVSKGVLLFLALIFLILIVAQVCVSAGLLEAAPISAMFDLYKSIALPIITLILGHYFGARGRSAKIG